MKTIQQRILEGIEALKAPTEENVVLVVSFDDYLDYGCFNFIYMYPNDDFIINSKYFTVVRDGKPTFNSVTFENAGGFYVEIAKIIEKNGKEVIMHDNIMTFN